jgi:hypothetical protein
MQLTIEEAAKKKLFKDAGISVTKSHYTSKILNNEIGIEACCYENNLGTKLVESWNKQHPLIHTWLLLSSMSICFLSALFFIIP